MRGLESTYDYMVDMHIVFVDQIGNCVVKEQIIMMLSTKSIEDEGDLWQQPCQYKVYSLQLHNTYYPTLSSWIPCSSKTCNCNWLFLMD